MDISKRIRTLRKSLDITQEQLAKACGVSTQTVIRWEAGEREPSGDTLRSLVSALDTSVAYLMGETSNPQQGKAANIVMPRFEDMVKVLILPREAKACNGGGFDWGGEAFEFESEWFIPAPDLVRRYGSYKLIGMYTEGDSMEPDIQDGAMVIFTPDERESIAAGRIMVVNYNGRMIVRGVIEQGNHVILRAKNKEYVDITVKPDDDFWVCGRVLKIISMDDPKPVI